MNSNLNNIEKVLLRWTDSISDEEIEDFLSVQRRVFGKESIGIDSFNLKYKNNIYGESLIIIIYVDHSPIAARAFWRNDINGGIAFQPCDTAVLASFRGKGLFYRMTILAREEVLKRHTDALIYNYPNRNSYHGYLNLNWSLRKQWFYRIFFPTKFNVSQIESLDSAYFNWWIRGNPQKKICAKKIGRRCLIVSPIRKNIYGIIGQVMEEDIHDLKRIYSPVLVYKSADKGLFSKFFNITNLVVFGDDVVNTIPYYKMDAI